MEYMHGLQRFHVETTFEQLATLSSRFPIRIRSHLDLRSRYDIKDTMIIQYT
jgi:hypothetical protein